MGVTGKGVEVDVEEDGAGAGRIPVKPRGADEVVIKDEEEEEAMGSRGLAIRSISRDKSSFM